MRIISVYNKSQHNKLLGDKIAFAETWAEKKKGLLGHTELGPGEGMFFYWSGPIHSFGMKFNFDAIFLNREQKVTALSENIPPGRFITFPNTFSVLEMAAGTIAKEGIRMGDLLFWL